MQALLNITDYVVEEVTVKGNPTFRKSEKEQAGALQIAFNFRRKSKEPSFMVSMIIEILDSKEAADNYPYFISLRISGFYRFPKGTDEETMYKMISLNGVTMLFGIARGVVAQITANGVHGKFILPAINFVEAIKKSKLSSNEPNKKKKGRKVPAG